MTPILGVSCFTGARVVDAEGFARDAHRGFIYWRQSIAKVREVKERVVVLDPRHGGLQDQCISNFAVRAKLFGVPRRRDN
jgi:hypothetical protein